MVEVKIEKLFFAPPPSRNRRVRSSKFIQIRNLHYYEPHTIIDVNIGKFIFAPSLCSAPCPSKGGGGRGAGSDL